MDSRYRHRTMIMRKSMYLREREREAEVSELVVVV